MTAALVLGEVATTALAFVLILAAFGICLAVMYAAWAAGEWVVRRVARRLDVPYRQRKAWWQR